MPEGQQQRRRTLRSAERGTEFVDPTCRSTLWLLIVTRMGRDCRPGSNRRITVVNEPTAKEAALGTGTDRGQGLQVLRCSNILLVEDHDINQMLMTDILHGFGISVDIAGKGEEALARVQQAAVSGLPYDLVLMDVRKPVMNGLDATRAIRAAGHDSDRLPIVALTANGFADDVAACLEAGMQSHLTKPISATELEEAIATWSRPSSNRVSLSGEAKPAMPVKLSLQQRYAERKRQTIEKLAELVRLGTLSGSEMSELDEMLHKLAGAAGMIGEAELGKQARIIEVGMQGWIKEGQIGRINEALNELQNAA